MRRTCGDRHSVRCLRAATSSSAFFVSPKGLPLAETAAGGASRARHHGSQHGAHAQQREQEQRPVGDIARGQILPCPLSRHKRPSVPHRDAPYARRPPAESTPRAGSSRRACAQGGDARSQRRAPHTTSKRLVVVKT